MREFFKGWRRKAGVVALVMACAFASGWVRSLFRLDVTSFRPCQSLHCLISKDGELTYRRLSPSEADKSFGGLMSLKWHSAEMNAYSRSNYKNYWNDCEIHWHLHWSSFDFGATTCEVTQNNPTVTWRQREDNWQIPYYAVVIPLSVLSAYMLLSKPRPAKKSAEPSPAEAL